MSRRNDNNQNLRSIQPEHFIIIFTDEDVASWTAGGRFATRWANKGAENEYRNEVYLDLCRRAANLNLPVMDIACGPGLGLLPDIYTINPAIQALATDACPAVVEKWSYFLKQHAPEKTFLRRIEKDDWELGEAAVSFGLEIAMIFKAFVLRKPEKGTTEIR